MAHAGKQHGRSLTVSDLISKDPLHLFKKWYEEAQVTPGVKIANSATLATASKAGQPSSRIMAVKAFDKSGFKFATNVNSLKARNVDENPYASLLFDWEPANRMVRIDGKVTKLSNAAAANIWQGLCRTAQLLHSASRQDDVIKTIQEVIVRKEELEVKYSNCTPIPKNPDWCAYELIPESWEFYQVGCEFPDRIVFRRPHCEECVDGVILHQGLEGWVIETLSP